MANKGSLEPLSAAADPFLYETDRRPCPGCLQCLRHWNGKRGSVMRGLDGKTAIIAGGATLIGQTVAETLAGYG